jgi:hypothetical protein
MKAQSRPPIRLASVFFIAALVLILAPAGAVHAQANSTEIPSSNGAAAKPPSGGETGQPAETGTAQPHHKHAHAQPQARKKKQSFMHKMRDKAMDKFQKYFGKKQEDQPPKSEPKQAPQQIPQKDIE